MKTKWALMLMRTYNSIEIFTTPFWLACCRKLMVFPCLWNTCIRPQYYVTSVPSPSHSYLSKMSLHSPLKYQITISLIFLVLIVAAQQQPQPRHNPNNKTTKTVVGLRLSNLCEQKFLVYVRRPQNSFWTLPQLHK